jgi:uncharacterized SAM-binding protein YcdF (DUF218 family)
MKNMNYVVICLILIVILIYIFQEKILLAIGNFLIIQDHLQLSDVIHVASGPDYRTNYAIQLYKQGLGKFLFFTGGWCEEIQGVHADRSRQQAIEENIPAGNIGVDAYQVVSTFQEAQRLKLWIEQTQMPVHSVIIVSDPHHMRRARWAYQQVLGKNVKLIMAPVPFAQTPYQQRWWTDSTSRIMVRDEYIKMVYYYARYKFSWGPLKDWLASFDTE